MSASRTVNTAAGVALGGALALLLGGCTYDYLQRSDRVAYSAGDAVKANLEQETSDPSKDSMYVTRGLGKDGIVDPGSDVAPPAQ